MSTINDPAETASLAPHAATPTPLQFKSFREIMAEPLPEIAYCVDGLIPMGGVTVIVGKPKVGKSTLVRQLAASVATGTELLSRSTIKGSVLYLALEEMQSEVARHFCDLGLVEDNPVHFHFGRIPGGLDEAVKYLESYIHALTDVALVIIDPLINMLKVRDANDYTTVYPAMMKILGVARETGVAIVAVHHGKKREGDDLTDGVLGSTAIPAAADNVFEIKASGEARTISTRQRLGRSLEPTQLQWDSASHRMTLGQTAQAIEESSRAATTQRIQNGIVSFVRLYPGCTQETIRGAVTGNALQKNDALNALVEAGIVLRIGAGHRGNPYTYQVSEPPDKPTNAA